MQPGLYLGHNPDFGILESATPSLNRKPLAALTQFPSGIQFKYPWRNYQKKVLDELEDHLSNRHLHVIAPPGSGKTVLGLEVALRINNPTLVLAPTVAIRNQWIQRFCELFLQTQEIPGWISRDIRNPRFMTVVTYQGLHAACNNFTIIEEEQEEEDIAEDAENGNGSYNKNLDAIVKGLQAQQIKTIVVDEAHHLKNEWWQTLTKIKERLDPVIVGLTATPPYDVSYNEWQRYLELNGPIDTEISVPELVIEGDLCPHQDYIYFSAPTETESKAIDAFRHRIQQLFAEIRSDETLLKAIEKHPVISKPIEHLDWIYNNLPCYSAAVIFLHANGRAIPPSHLEIVGEENPDIPELDYEWMETLLDFYFFRDKDNFAPFEEHRLLLETKLKKAGAIERRQISLTQNKKLTGLLTSSISKLNSIKEIVEFEYKQTGNDLRLVILTDYIRKEFLASTTENQLPLTKTGAIPVFECLRRANQDGKKIAVLTGSVIILPQSALQAFRQKAEEYRISSVHTLPLPYDNNYVTINQTEQLKHDIVHIITQIFQDGEIEILIGTKSLLGEGWDAPAINSLILASFVGSFVLSNQMRGRAIRTYRNNIHKTGNIWHLVCADPASASGGDDLDLLKRRFRSFVGVSYHENGGIENGTGRLLLPAAPYSNDAIAAANRETLLLAADRESLKQRWQKALQKGTTLVEEIKVPFPEQRPYSQAKNMYYNKTIAYLAAMLISGLLGFGMASLEAFGKMMRFVNSPETIYSILAGLGSLAVALFGRLAYNTFRLYIKYRDISKDIQKIGEVLLQSLIKAGVINTDGSHLRVESAVDSEGAVYCHLEGATTFEKSAFINSLQEIVGPVDNPRYIIIRKSRFLHLKKQQDYHSVPDILGKKKELAEYFSNLWSKEVGRCELVFTRTVQGRKLVLRARIKSLAAQFESEPQQVSKWR